MSEELSKKMEELFKHEIYNNKQSTQTKIKAFKNLPPELISNIFKHSIITPNIFKSFKPFLCPKTKLKIITDCNQIIGLNFLTEKQKIKELKIIIKEYNNQICSNSLISVIKNKYSEIFHYFENNNLISANPDLINLFSNENIHISDIEFYIKNIKSWKKQFSRRSDYSKYNIMVDYYSLFTWFDRKIQEKTSKIIKLLLNYPPFPNSKIDYEEFAEIIYHQLPNNIHRTYIYYLIYNIGKKLNVFKNLPEEFEPPHPYNKLFIN